MSQTLHTARVVEVTEKDLPLHCPLPAETVWNAHPRVFLPIEEKGEARCPYCGTLYRLKGGPVAGHH
ncbi:MAG: zinc-finger domain-containing protein [Hydrogenophilaceae bacterium]|nr:zinc-finger domain-containing protein [Hydrogenophilaceae bacterium]